MPSFNNEKLLDIVTKRLVSSNAAPTLSRPDSDIFWRVMSDDIYRQLCGNKGSAGTVPLGLDTSKRDLTVAALQRKIGAPETLPEFSIPRVRIGVGAFYLTSQPIKAIDKKDVSLPSRATGPIGISVYEDYLVKYNLKCRRHIAARQLPDGTAQPTDINAPRMYFEAANALTSLYGRTGAVPPPPHLALPRVEGSLRTASASSSLLRPMSGVGSRPSSSASSRSKAEHCILDDLSTLRQALCRKFVQTVVEILGELGSDPNNDVEIVLHPKIGTLKIRSKVVSLILADSGQEADGDPAALQANRSLPIRGAGAVGAGGMMSINRKRHHGDRELRLALESVARGGNGVEVEQSHQYIDDEDGVLYEDAQGNEGGNRGVGGKPPLIRAKAPMSNKMRLILQKREEAKREKGYVVPISDEDSAFSGPSVNGRREEQKRHHQAAKENLVEAREQHKEVHVHAPLEGEEGGTNKEFSCGGRESPFLDSVRRMKITNKFEPKIDHESIQRYREQQRPPSSSSSTTSSSLLMTYGWLGTNGIHARKTARAEENRNKTLQHLDAKLTALRSQLNDPLEELERNTYGNDYVDGVLRSDSQTKGNGAHKLESPAATRDRRMREYEEKYVVTAAVKNNSNLLNSVSGADEEKVARTFRGYASATTKRNATRGNPILGISPSAANSGSNQHIVPASKIIELNFGSGGIGDPNPHVAAGANRRFFSLREQDVSTLEDIVQRRSERISNQVQHGRALKAQSKLKNEEKAKEVAADILIQKKETEVQVLSEALAILDKMRQKREAAAAVTT